jgi:hypothetical protein
MRPTPHGVSVAARHDGGSTRRAIVCPPLQWEDSMAKQSFDPRSTLVRLEEQHRTLKQEVAFLERRAFLTPAEQLAASALKKKKLATKDAISAIRAIAS